MPEAFRRVRRLRELLPEGVHVQVDSGGVGQANAAEIREAGANLLVAGTSVFGEEDIAAAYRQLVQEIAYVLERALGRLAERGRGTTHPNPVVGAVVVREEGRRRRVARAEGGGRTPGGRARRSGRACPGRDSLRDARALPALGRDPSVHEGCARAGSPGSAPLDPNPKAGGGLEELRDAGSRGRARDRRARSGRVHRTMRGEPGSLCAARSSPTRPRSRSTAG